MHEPRDESAIRIALPEPTSTDTAYNQRAWGPYFHALTASGAVGVPIPLEASPATIHRLVASCAGILLPGSPADIDPRSYHAEPHIKTAAPDPAREAVDAQLIEAAFRDRKPVFGICFGLQSLNVWLGGSLLQHLPATTVDHDPGPAILSAHTVRILPNTRLAGIASPAADLVSITEPSATIVNSSHHQAINGVGKELIVSARCPEDNVIEAIELAPDASAPRDHFVLAVQWHPERSFDASETSRRLFRAFVAAAAANTLRPLAAALAL